MAAGDFTTPAQVKTFLFQKPGVTTDLGLIEQLISGVSAEFVTVTQRDLLSTTYTEVRDGTGTNTLTLLNYPVTAVSSLQVGLPNCQRTLNPTTDYFATQWAVKLLWGIFPYQVGAVTIIYTAGYATLPNDLAIAAAKAVAYRYKQLIRLGENNKLMGQETVAFETDPWPKDVAATLDRYTRRFQVAR